MSGPGRGGRRLRRHRAGALVACLLALAGCWIERRPAVTPDEAQLALERAVGAMLDESASSWNRGEFEGFIDDYLVSPSTTYLGGGGLVLGYDEIRARFAPAFAPGVVRGHLDFEDLRVRRLGTEHALVTARFVLTREGEVISSGPFTLVLRRVEGNWRIIHDHTSTDPPPDTLEG